MTKRRKKKSTKKDFSRQKKFRGEAPSFRKFVNDRYNKGLTANEIIRRYRAKGGSIGNDKGKAIIREELEREYQAPKATRVKTFTVDQKNPSGKQYHTTGFIHVVSFVNELAYPTGGRISKGKQRRLFDERVKLTLVAEHKMTKKEVIAALDELIAANNQKKNIYRMIKVKKGSVKIEYIVDNSRPDETPEQMRETLDNLPPEMGGF